MLSHVFTDDSQRERQTLSRGPLVLDLPGYAVAVGGRDIAVTATEFLLLRALALQPYRVLGRAALAAAVHAQGYGQTPQPMSPRAVDLHISRLRKKLSRAGYDCIRTMRFVGYRFVPPAATDQAAGGARDAGMAADQDAGPGRAACSCRRCRGPAAGVTNRRT